MRLDRRRPTAVAAKYRCIWSIGRSPTIGRRYAGKYRATGEPIQMGGSRSRGEAAGFDDGQPVHLIGVEFSRATRTLTAFETADA